MAREAHAERVRIEKYISVVEETELIPFTYWAGRSALFPGKIKDLGLIPKSIVLER